MPADVLVAIAVLGVACTALAFVAFFANRPTTAARKVDVSAMRS